MATASLANNVVTVSGLTVGSTSISVADSRASRSVPVTVTGTTGGGGGTTGNYALLAWNDLGMHCVDGSDYSVFSILPPYNNLHAQLVNTSNGSLVTSGVTLSYESVADATGSINTISSTKTNFWQYVQSLFGVQPVPDVGLTGNPTASLTPAADEIQRDAGLVRGRRHTDHAGRRHPSQEFLSDGESRREGQRRHACWRPPATCCRSATK